MMSEFLSIIKSTSPNPNLVQGYTSEEISKIESLYGISVNGEFREFMANAGKCDGGAIGDDPLILYRTTWNARTHVLFQLNLFNDLQDLGAWSYINRPFVFCLVSETQYYYLMTGNSNDLVYHYDENASTVKCTGLSLGEYLLNLYYNESLNFPGTRQVTAGDLLRLD